MKNVKKIIHQLRETNYKKVYGTCAGCGVEKEGHETWYLVRGLQVCGLPCKRTVEALIGYKPIDTYA